MVDYITDIEISGLLRGIIEMTGYSVEELLIQMGIANFNETRQPAFDMLLKNNQPSIPFWLALPGKQIDQMIQLGKKYNSSLDDVVNALLVLGSEITQEKQMYE